MSMTVSLASNGCMTSTPFMIMKPVLDVAAKKNIYSVLGSNKPKDSDTPTDLLLLVLLQSLEKSLVEIHDSVFNMEADEAKRMLLELETAGVKFEEMRAFFVETEHKNNLKTELDKQFIVLLKRLLDIFDDLIIVADTSIKVDEESDDYKAFIEKLATERLDEPPVYGRKALLALFN